MPDEKVAKLSYFKSVAVCLERRRGIKKLKLEKLIHEYSANSDQSNILEGLSSLREINFLALWYNLGSHDK